MAFAIARPPPPRCPHKRTNGPLSAATEKTANGRDGLVCARRQRYPSTRLAPRRRRRSTAGAMVIRMGWLAKLLGRPAKSEDTQEALEEQYAAEAARPESEQPPTSEP